MRNLSALGRVPACVRQERLLFSDSMKRNFLAIALACGGSLLSSSALADEAVIADLRLDNQKLTARVEDLESSLQSYKQQVMKLSEEVRSLKADLAKGADNREVAGLKEDVDRLREAIKEVDQKRIADQEKIAATIRDLGKDLKKSIQGSVSPAPRPIEPVQPRNGSPPASPPKSGGATGPQTGYEYTIRSGDTLLGIVTALKSQGIKITLEQLSEANPGVKSTNLKIGQKIFIPVPGQ